jgi:AcrR family transcriptional regulator
VISILRENRKKELKEQIFFKAIELFKEKGYENVTVEEIAKVCSIAKGTFFNYFQKKEHVLLHLGNSQIQQMEQIIQKHSFKSLKEQLQHIFGDLLTAYLENSALLKLALSETIKSALVMKEESANIQLFQKTLCGIIQEAKETGALQSSGDSNVIASVLVGIYFNTLFSWSLIEAEEVNIVGMFQKQFELVWEGIEG